MNEFVKDLTAQIKYWEKVLKKAKYNMKHPVNNTNYANALKNRNIALKKIKKIHETAKMGIAAFRLITMKSNSKR